MRYDADFLDLLREKSRLSEVIGQKIRLQKRGREFVGLCPFHKEKTPSFYVSDTKGSYHCFGCGASGDVFGFLCESFNYTFSDAVEEVARLTHTALPEKPREEDYTAPDQREKLIRIHEDVCTWYQQQLNSAKGLKARQYLESRGITDATLKQFRLGYSPNGNELMDAFIQRGYSHDDLIEAGLLIKGENGIYDRFRDRLMFPIFSPRGEVIAFGGRILGEGNPKYLNSPETPLFHKKYTLYAANFMRPLLKTHSTVYIVEGYMDVIAMIQAGVGPTVAPLGTALTEEQVQSVWKYCAEPVLCFDGDAAGLNAAARSAERVLPILKAGYSVNFALLSEGEDPDSLIRSGSIHILKEQLNHPLSLFEMLWQHHVAGAHAKTPEQQAKVQKDFFTRIEGIKDLAVCYPYKNMAKDRFFKHFRSYSRKEKQPEVINRGIRTRFDVRKRQRMILFAVVLNHPQLLNDVEDDLARLDIPETEAELCQLRDEIFNWFAHTQTLDASDLNTQLQMRGLDSVIKEIRSPIIYQHASFAKPDTSLESAREGWQEVWFMLEGNVQLSQQREAIRKELLDSMDVEAWNRLQALQNQVIKN